MWEGEALEGFVVRTEVTAPHNGGRGSVSLSPYEPGSSFFFKVKFDEPYMMYRDWREITKKLLSTKGPLSGARLPKSKLKRPETILYVKWIKGEIGRDRGQFENFNKGKGIIATRERFLKWMDTGEAQEAAADEDASTLNVTYGKTIILPIAVPGVGEGLSSATLGQLLTSLQEKHLSRWLSNTSSALGILKAMMSSPRKLLLSSSRTFRRC